MLVSIVVNYFVCRWTFFCWQTYIIIICIVWQVSFFLNRFYYFDLPLIFFTFRWLYSQMIFHRFPLLVLVAPTLLIQKCRLLIVHTINYIFIPPKTVEKSKMGKFVRFSRIHSAFVSIYCLVNTTSTFTEIRIIYHSIISVQFR